jgi:thiaminase
MFCCLFLFQFANEEALANELAGYFYLEIGQNVKATVRLLLAHKKYHEWVSVCLCR